MDFNTTDLLLLNRETLSSTSVVHTDQFSTFSKANDLSDRTLGLDCLGYKVGKSGRSLNLQTNFEFPTQDDSCHLVLGLGPTPNFYSAGHATNVSIKPKESASSSSQSVLGTEFGMLDLGLSRGNYAVPTIQDGHHTEMSLTGICLPIPVVDEGSTSAKRKSGGYIPTLLFAPGSEMVSSLQNPTVGKELVESLGDVSAHQSQHQQYVLSQQPQLSPETSAATYCSLGCNDPLVVGGSADHRIHHHPKKCRFNGCLKGARGASGLCIAHGGGQRCQKPGCKKGAESRTVYCKAHGGGRRCQQLGCTKSAEGKTEFCIAHGGGRRCGHLGCTKAARGKSGLCIRHGGGKRCTVEDCMRSAEGQAGRCISHGGGRRCQYLGCSKGAQGSTLYCKAHGGGKRCIFEGCSKGAEGSTSLCKGHGGGKRCLFEGGGVCPKSVHGGTNFCVAHGGGKRCAVPGCTKSARGRTDCCVRHGGGKRCKFEGCGKSAQGSTDFCKAHGGGKRCSWVMGCEKFARGKSGLCAAHGSLIVAQNEQKAGSPIASTSITHGSHKDNEISSSGVSSLSDCTESESYDSMGMDQHHIPPHELAPQSMGSQSSSFGSVFTEGRVHGGGLMSFLGRNLKKAVNEVDV